LKWPILNKPSLHPVQTVLHLALKETTTWKKKVIWSLRTWAILLLNKTTMCLLNKWTL